MEQSKEVEFLKKQNQILTEQLKQRRIILENAGSIAEAAMELNHIFKSHKRQQISMWKVFRSCVNLV